MKKVRPGARSRHPGRSACIRLPLAAAIHFACLTAAYATDADQNAPPAAPADQTTAAQSAAKPTAALGEVTVTAQKRVENAQAVPLSIEVLSTDKLSEMNVNGLTDYVKMLPSVSLQSASPGFSQIYMRGVASGSTGNSGIANHSGPMPSVGVYLDEEPITTIQGALDVHIYDIARVEALAGPQGTLYGASSQSGTIRIITNKPDPSAFSASVSTELNSISHGTLGYTVEGFVNVPLRENLALRVVGWNEHDGGYIDNVLGSRTYPTSGITVSNANLVHDDYNESWLKGARAALKLDLNDDWSITPTIMGQSQHNGGIYAFDPKLGDLKVSHSLPEHQEDRWVQSALTVQGKIGNFDLVYAYSHLNRSDWLDQDYADYSFWYDTLSGYGKYITDKNGNYIDPRQHIHGEDQYAKSSHELRISSPKDERFRFVAGFFAERQSHRIYQNYQIDGFDPALSPTGWPGTLWLTKQHRVDEDYAVFGEASYDITDRLTATVGERFFHTENSLRGFFGFGQGYDQLTSSSQGEIACFSNYKFDGAPCTNLDKTTKQNDHVGKANLTYKFEPDKMIYATWSEGFRPGGINRRGTLPPYQADFLTNYEFGWKTEWFDHRLRWNGAVYEEKWKDFQFAILGANGLTEIKNANQARIRGIESNLTWAATYNLTLSGGFSFLKSELTANYCGATDANDQPITNCAVGSVDFPNGPQAPKGTRLPVSPKQKANISARYVFDAFGGEGYFQVAGFVEGRRRTDLRIKENGLIGDMPGYGSVDLSAGLKKDAWAYDVYMKNAFDSRGELNRYAECAIASCVQPPGSQYANAFGQTYIVPIQPRTIGVRVTRNFD